MKSPITTHILDTSLGAPAPGVFVELSRVQDGQHVLVGSGTTDTDGRISDGLIRPEEFLAGVYRICFQTSKHFEKQQQETFYPEVSVTFVIKEDQPHYHIPLLISPFGFTTYRGS